MSFKVLRLFLEIAAGNVSICRTSSVPMGGHN